MKKARWQDAAGLFAFGCLAWVAALHAEERQSTTEAAALGGIGLQAMTGEACKPGCSPRPVSPASLRPKVSVWPQLAADAAGSHRPVVLPLQVPALQRRS